MMKLRMDRDTAVRNYRVTGGGGVELNVEEAGNGQGPPVLFIHGFSQSCLAWSKQLHSGLADDLRLVAMDLRGHGASGRPHGDYGDPARWADDVHAVIATLGLERPILCGWSYGGVVIGDYLRSYGEDALGGVALVGAVSRLGEPVMPFLGADFVATLPGLFSSDVEANTAAVETFIRISTCGLATPEDFYATLGYNCVVPPHVRQALMSRTVIDDDMFEALTRPVLIMHGLSDRIVLPSMSEHLASLIPHAKVSFLEGIGHMPFREDPDRFNDGLRTFASSLS